MSAPVSVYGLDSHALRQRLEAGEWSQAENETREDGLIARSAAKEDDA